MNQRSSCVEVFSGAGGLALGLRLAGFELSELVEQNETCVETLNQNREHLGLTGPVVAGDIKDVDWTKYRGKLDLLAGGLPCQPFSFGGKSNGHRDVRNAFPKFIRAVQMSRPRAVLVENVKGFASETFLDYFDYVVLQLEMPSLGRRNGETWKAHAVRLKLARKTYVRAGELAYNVVAKVLQAADYGVPQLRERLFIVGIRRDLGVTWMPPQVTHSLEALGRSKAAGGYWRRHHLHIRSAPLSSKQHHQPAEEPWRTVRDACSGLGKPGRADDMKLRHFKKEGATEYAGHVGSSMDMPAKTIKAGVHGVPGGENMIRFQSGHVRYFTLREAARIQGFPDGFKFAGSWTQAFRQLGNAVPVGLAKAVAESVAATLAASSAVQGKLSVLRRVG